MRDYIKKIKYNKDIDILIFETEDSYFKYSGAIYINGKVKKIFGANDSVCEQIKSKIRAEERKNLFGGIDEKYIFIGFKNMNFPKIENVETYLKGILDVVDFSKVYK